MSFKRHLEHFYLLSVNSSAGVGYPSRESNFFIVQIKDKGLCLNSQNDINNTRSRKKVKSEIQNKSC